MNLRSVDLNLLVALDALLTEKHVTRAATKVGLSQSAMSSALGRLRILMRDELLIRNATGMEPTPRALELEEPLRQLLHQAERLLESDGAFDPATTAGHFRLRMSDVLEYLLMPPLLAQLEQEAPGVTLDVVHLSPGQTVTALEADDIDVAVSMDLEHAGAVQAMPLFDDRMVCVMARDHPCAAEALTLDLFLSLPHLKVSISSTDGRYVDAKLAGMRRARNVVLNVPHWLVVPHLLRHSSMVAVMSARLAERFAADGLVLKALPFESAGFHWSMYWHRRHDSVPAQAWLREKIREAAEPMRLLDAQRTAG
ncbi:LysR family transcriptional regulator [Burkholderia lata]|uniref:Transcriptional regulator, LysR family n=1 Tax=Burkholderia lata (strain ATCC 17760 / DSM 23089 / LMG 22485 / NCIMB 9086 / R18194 / 383) TaxID=482957 RepID=Q393U0_BURL3|nr:LysR family transcriptional regulator [Burkholderia lata]ABB12276.1 transcriptional regulator, LysR family [Burkholderia lata]